MSYICCVSNCPTKKTDKNSLISLHTIPVKENIRSQWLRLLAKHGSLSITDYSAVCSLHFTPEDFKKDSKKRMLLPTAAPSIFPQYPSSLDHLERNQMLKGKKSKRKGMRLATENSMTCCDPEDQINTRHTCHEQFAGSHNNLVRTRSIGVQVSRLRTGHLQQLKKDNQRLRAQHHRLQETLKTLKIKVSASQEKFDSSSEYHKVKKIKECLSDVDMKATFLIEQVNNFDKQQPHWSDFSLEECLEWRSLASKGYEHARTQQLITLPSRCTLERYVKYNDPENSAKSKNNSCENAEKTIHTIIIKESPWLCNDTSDSVQAVVVKNMSASDKSYVTKNLQIPSFETLIDDTLHAIVIKDITKPDSEEGGDLGELEHPAHLCSAEKAINLFESNFDEASEVNWFANSSQNYGRLSINDTLTDINLDADSECMNNVFQIEIS